MDYTNSPSLRRDVQGTHQLLVDALGSKIFQLTYGRVWEPHALKSLSASYSSIERDITRHLGALSHFDSLNIGQITMSPLQSEDDETIGLTIKAYDPSWVTVELDGKHGPDENNPYAGLDYPPFISVEFKFTDPREDVIDDIKMLAELYVLHLHVALYSDIFQWFAARDDNDTFIELAKFLYASDYTRRR